MSFLERNTLSSVIKEKTLKIRRFCAIKLSRTKTPYEQYRLLMDKNLGVPPSWNQPTERQKDTLSRMFPGTNFTRPPDNTTVPPSMEGGRPPDM